MIHYFCADVQLTSSGMRLLYKHVEILNRHGIRAAILHQHPGFRLEGTPAVPIGYLSVPNTLSADDIVVVPELWANLLAQLHPLPLKLVVVAFTWKFINSQHESCNDWRRFNVRRVLVNSPFIAEMIGWAMQIPCHLTTMGVDPALYYDEPQQKAAQISYIGRKAPDMEDFKALLRLRNPAYVDTIVWKSLHDLPEADYAREIRRSQLFLNLWYAEGFPFSMVEAMRAGTLAAGYNSVGGQSELVGAGPLQNCILSENFDYVTLARRLESVLDDMLRRDLTRWRGIIQNGIELSRRYTLEEEERTALQAWREILAAI